MAATVFLQVPRVLSAGSGRAAFDSGCLQGIGRDARSISFLFEKISHRALLGRRFECINKFPKPLRENFRTKVPIMGDPGRRNVMSKKPMPAIPELFIH